MNSDHKRQKAKGEGRKGLRETLKKSFDRLRTNGKLLIMFMVSPSASLRRTLSNHLSFPRVAWGRRPNRAAVRLTRKGGKSFAFRLSSFA